MRNLTKQDKIENEDKARAEEGYVIKQNGFFDRADAEA
jgi:hypothetical protein